MAPSIVKLFPNMPHPGFSDVEGNEPAQSILLDAAKPLVTENKILLNLAKFQSVNRFSFCVISI
jgi:hypothetical protein